MTADRFALATQPDETIDVFVDLTADELSALFALESTPLSPAWLTGADNLATTESQGPRAESMRSLRSRGAVDANDTVVAPLLRTLQIAARPEVVVSLWMSGRRGGRRHFLCTPELSVEVRALAPELHRFTVFSTTCLVERVAAAAGLADQGLAAGQGFHGDGTALAAAVSDPSSDTTQAFVRSASDTPDAEAFADALRRAGGATAVEAVWLSSPTAARGIQQAWVDGGSGLWRIDPGAVFGGRRGSVAVAPTTADEIVRMLVSALPGPGIEGSL